MSSRRTLWALTALLAAALVKLWILPLPSTFWVDEMVTAFVVHYGAAHPSLAVAPQLLATNYYWLPWASEKLFGFSEVAYRLPSVMLMGAALGILALLAKRLIHAEAGWFAVFAALTLPGLNYEADDARPYALAIFAAAGAALFLVRWLDTAHWRDAAVFIVFGALLWRVHLIDWPFYFVLAGYPLLRRFRGETPVGWGSIAAVFGILGAALIPVLLTALKLIGEAKAHVIFAQPPTWRELRGGFKFLLVFGAGAGAWLLSIRFHWPLRKPLPACSLFLILDWWISQPLALFAFSRVTGENIFVPRYLSLSLPGAALAAAAAIAYFLPDEAWRPASLALGAIVVVFIGGVPTLTPRHHPSGWREASLEIRKLNLAPDTPIFYPSPFIEAQAPAWRPDYPLPGFLYCHLLMYPAGGKPFLLPNTLSLEGKPYAAEVASGTLPSAMRFVIYGGDVNVDRWQQFFSQQPKLSGWRFHELCHIGDVKVVVFENAVEKPFQKVFETPGVH